MADLAELRKKYCPESEIGESDTIRDKIRRMCRQNKLAVFSFFVIVVIMLAAIFAPLVAPYNPYART